MKEATSAVRSGALPFLLVVPTLATIAEVTAVAGRTGSSLIVKNARALRDVLLR